MTNTKKNADGPSAKRASLTSKRGRDLTLIVLSFIARWRYCHVSIRPPTQKIALASSS